MVLNRKFPVALVVIGHFALLYLKLSARPFQNPVRLLANVYCSSAVGIHCTGM